MDYRRLIATMNRHSSLELWLWDNQRITARGLIPCAALIVIIILVLLL